MQQSRQQFGIIGLGSIGGRLALQALDKGFQVVGYTPSGASEEQLQAGLLEAQDEAGLAAVLERPRRIIVYVPAGQIVDEVIDNLLPHLEPDDIIVDGGNSYWGDSIRRHQQLQHHGIHFVDLGTSGGVSGARYGACFMVGGEASVVAHLEPILHALSVEGGYVHAGPPGAGHFVKLVHNGIEFGMLQAIAEGVDLLTHYHEELPIAEVLHCWNNGSVIRSWLVELMEQQYKKEGSFDDIPSYVEDTGEVNWLINDALHFEVPVPVMAQAVMQLLASRREAPDWARAVAMMRHGFGGHPYGPDEDIRKERREGRLGTFYTDETDKL